MKNRAQKAPDRQTASASVVVSRDSRECAARLLLQRSAVCKVVLSEWYAIYNSSSVAAEQSTRIQRSLFYAKRDDDVVATAAQPRAITFDNIHGTAHIHAHKLFQMFLQGIQARARAYSGRLCSSVTCRNFAIRVGVCSVHN
uniref:Uncharacterized protein n=1 Tax=Trichogramma kaykai TaxID=54128 RepID=A0ABD2XDK2_9HYME